MARWEFKLPDIGEGVAEGEIVAWGEGVAIGSLVKADQPLAEIMTDKATVTITSPKTGKVLELGGKVGEIIKVHTMLVVLDLDGASAVDAPAAPKESAATAVGDIKESLPGTSRGAPLAAKPATAPTTQRPPAPMQPIIEERAPESSPPLSMGAAYFADKPLATPATRKLARDLGVDLRTIPPTGPNNRVTRDDVEKRASNVANGHATNGASHEHTASEAAPAPVVQAPSAPHAMKITPPSAAHQELEERFPLKGVRKKIFEQMARSKHTAAHFTFVEECDVTALKELRARLKPAADKQGVKLTFLPFFVKAVVSAMKRYPELNSAFDETTQEIVRRKYFHIGIASATDAGLIVPVVKDADRRSILELAREIQRLGDATKEGKVKLEDLQGSTFTITSLGQQGGLFATPILNFPEVGILGIHQMKQKPVVRDGQIVVGDVMLMSLSFDHRIIDGHVGAAFAYEIIHYLEDPDRLFLEMS